MRRYLTLLAALAIVATTLAVALVVVAPAAQVERAPLTGKANPTLVGLLVFSSKAMRCTRCGARKGCCWPEPHNTREARDMRASQPQGRPALISRPGR